MRRAREKAPHDGAARASPTMPDAHSLRRRCLCPRSKSMGCRHRNPRCLRALPPQTNPERSYKKEQSRADTDAGRGCPIQPYRGRQETGRERQAPGKAQPWNSLHFLFLQRPKAKRTQTSLPSISLAQDLSYASAAEGFFLSESFLTFLGALPPEESALGVGQGPVMAPEMVIQIALSADRIS